MWIVWTYLEIKIVRKLYSCQCYLLARLQFLVVTLPEPAKQLWRSDAPHPYLPCLGRSSVELGHRPHQRTSLSPSEAAGPGCVDRFQFATTRPQPVGHRES